MKIATYSYEGRRIPQTTVFFKPYNKIPLETIIKLPTYQSLQSLKRMPSFLTITINGTLSKTFTLTGNKYLNGKESELDYLMYVQKNAETYREKGKLSIVITKN